MSIADALLAEYIHECATTRRCLERVPEDQLGWRPHEKSMSLGQLALHIANTPQGVLMMVDPDEMPAPDFGKAFPQPESKQQILSALDTSIAQAQQTLPGWDDAKLTGQWRLTRDGKDILAMPRAAFIRMVMLNHIYHHRGQLTVYLRLLGVPVPSVYGPSADEAPAFLQEAQG